MQALRGHSPNRSKIRTREGALAGSEKERPSKQRRLASDERQRAVRACDGCRRMKEKCEGGVPCKRCTRFQRPCEFTELNKPRVGSSDGSKVVSSSSVQELLERSTCMERILKHHLPGIDCSTFGLQQASQLLNSGSNPESRDGDRSRSDDDEESVEPEKCTINAVDRNVAHFSGELSYWNFSMRIKQHVKDLLPIHAYDGVQDSNDPDQVSDYWRVPKLHPKGSNLSQAIAHLPPREVADFLVQVFFRHAINNYFYVESNYLSQKIDSLYQTPPKASAQDAGSISIIFAVFAVATQHADLESIGGGIQAGEDGDSTTWDEEIGNLFYSQAASLLPDIIHLGSLESVQACLLLGLYALPVDASGLAYIYLNLAIRLAIQNGMHRRLTANTFPTDITETRNRVWWTAYSLEKRISIFHGRPMSVSQSNVDADLPCATFEIWTPEQSLNVSRMLASIRLTTYLEDFMTEMSVLKNFQKKELHKLLRHLRSMKESLENWWETPSLVNLRHNVSPHDPQFRPTIHLKLEYCLISMFIGRPFLLNSRTSGISPSTDGEHSTSQIEPSEDQNWSASAHSKRTSNSAMLVQFCVKAAKDAIDDCQRLRDSPVGLSKVSYIEYSSCRASLLVLIAYCIYNQTDEFSANVKTGLEMLRFMSSAGDSARSEVSLIEALENALKRLHSFSARADHATKTDSRPERGGYNAFRKWSSMQKSANSDQSVYNSLSRSTPKNETLASQMRGGADSSVSSTSMNVGNVNTALDHNINDASLSEAYHGSMNTDSMYSMAGGTEFYDFNEVPFTNYWYADPERALVQQFLAGPNFDVVNNGNGAEWTEESPEMMFHS